MTGRAVEALRSYMAGPPAISIRGLARQLDMDPYAIRCWLKGSLPRGPQRRSLEELTGGAVSAEMWTPLPGGKRAQLPEHGVWAGMHRRAKDFASGGLAWVCPEWDSFERFFTDMGRRPGNDCVLLRLDTSQPYSRENCAWVSQVDRRMRRPERCAWIAMKDRCFCRENSSWANYGGRGITVCDKWVHSFDAFFNDVGPRPSRQHSLDRIDNERGYEPGNVRWATKKEQCRNRRNTLFILFQGEKVTLGELCERFGLRASVVHKRLLRGDSPEQALCVPYVPRSQRRKAA